MPTAAIGTGAVYRQLNGGNAEQRSGGDSQEGGAEQHPAAIRLSGTAGDARTLPIVEQLEQPDVRRAQTDGENRHDPGLLSSHESLG